jgi:hypothetical protein
MLVVLEMQLVLSLITAQAQQAALLQTLIGNSASPSQAPMPFNTTGTSLLGFTPEQQAFIDMTTQLAVSKALAAQSQAQSQAHSAMMSPHSNMLPPMNPRPPAFSPNHPPPRQERYNGTPNAPSLRVGASSSLPTVSVGAGAGATFTLPLPDALNPARDKLDWYRWEPKVRSFYESIGFSEIMDQEKAIAYGYGQSDHSRCIRFLLEMIPAEDADHFVAERTTYNTMYAIWEQLVKEYGRHAKARVHALIRTFDAICQHSGETVGEYVMRLSRLVKTLKTCKEPPSELSHKLKLLNILPVLPGSEVQHTHFLGTLHNKLHEISVSDLEQDLIDHESAIMRQQDADILTARMNAVPGDRAPPMFPVSTGVPKLRYPLSRPPAGNGPQCCICWNDASPDIKRKYKDHGTKRCPNYNAAVGRAVTKWLTDNPKRDRRPDKAPKRPAGRTTGVDK